MGEVIVQWVQNFSFARFRVVEIDDGDGFPTMCICSNITALHTGLPHYLEVEHSHNTFRKPKWYKVKKHLSLIYTEKF